MPAASDPREIEADRVEREVAATLTPPPELLARLASACIALVERVRLAAETRRSPLVRAVIAGSAARETFLADRLDVDLFLLFPPELSDDRLREEGLALGRAVLTDSFLRYAEHPYLRGSFEGFTVDAVPGFAVDDASKPRSPVDRTPFHQEYLAARETPRLVSDIRLTKQFLRGLGVYGSEARTEGFSGYLVELLVVRFGGFRGLLRAARSWRVPVQLETAEHAPPRLPAEVALVLADPVDPHRNVASALSRRNLGTFIVSARAYLEGPQTDWFRPRPAVRLTKADAERLRLERASHIAIVRLARPELVDDTLYPQLRKAERAIADELGRSGFVVVGSASAADPRTLVVAVETAYRSRPGVRVNPGPPAGLDRSGDFLAAWPPDRAGVLQGPYIRPDGSLAVESREADRELETFLARRLPHLSLGRNLSSTDGASVASLAEVEESPAVGEALTGLLGRELPWPPGARRRSTSG